MVICTCRWLQKFGRFGPLPPAISPLKLLLGVLPRNLYLGSLALWDASSQDVSSSPIVFTGSRSNYISSM